LDALIYRSENQTRALIEQLFQRVLPDLAAEGGWTNLIDRNWMDLLGDLSRDPQIRLVAVARNDDPPLKSSYAILRLMKRHFRVQEEWTTAAWNLGVSGLTNDTAIIFVDDFLGTGDQFEKFFTAESLAAVTAGMRVAYVPLVAFTEGIEYLERGMSGLRVRAVEVLSNKHRLFHSESDCFSDGSNSPSSAEDFYYDLLSSKGIPLMGNERRGHGGLELAYAFQHAAPDNCLPILWWAESSQWIPLFNR